MPASSPLEVPRASPSTSWDGRCWRLSTLVRNIRLAEAKDIPAILDVCRKHHESVPFGIVPFSGKKVAKILSDAVSGDRTKACLFVSTDGNIIVGAFLAAVAEVSFSEEPIATELAFWVLPGYRRSRRVLDLVAAYEYWAKEIAKTRFILLSKTPTEDVTERSYKRLGYTSIEQNYLKKIR